MRRAENAPGEQIHSHDGAVDQASTIAAVGLQNFAIDSRKCSNHARGHCAVIQCFLHSSYKIGLVQIFVVGYLPPLG